MDERLIKQGRCNQVKNMLYVENGYYCLTDTRFLYSRMKFTWYENVRQRPFSYDVEIYLNEVTDIKKMRHGLGHKIIITDENHREYAFAVLNTDTFMSQIEDAVENAKKATARKQQNAAQEFSIADEILKFKKLLDMGAISQEEFDKKKKELL